MQTKVIDQKRIERHCHRAFGVNATLSKWEPLAGGAYPRSVRVVVNGESFVLRCYRGKTKLCQKEANLYSLVHRQITVQELVYTDDEDGVAIFRFAPGSIIHQVEYPSIVSYDLGKTLAAIHGISFPKSGFLGPDLKVEESFPVGTDPYFEYIKEHFVMDCLAWRRLGDELAKMFQGFVEYHRHDFPKIKEGGTLVHSDFKMVNLLWDDKRGLTVLDWEFAHSGDPLMDFATLIRHFDRIPLDIEALEKGYADGGKVLPQRWIQRARVLDFINYVQLLNSPLLPPKVIDQLKKCLVFTIQSYDNIDTLIKKGIK